MNKTPLKLESGEIRQFGSTDTLPTRLRPQAGSTSADTAPLKLTSGTFNTTPEAGAVEYDGRAWFTPGAGERRMLAMMTIATSNPSTAPQFVGEFYLNTSNGRLYVAIGTSFSYQWVRVQ